MDCCRKRVETLCTGLAGSVARLNPMQFQRLIKSKLERGIRNLPYQVLRKVFTFFGGLLGDFLGLI